MARRIELAAGTLVGLAGLLLLGATVYLFVDSSAYVDSTRALPMLSLTSGVLLAAAMAAFIHSRSEIRSALAVTWVAAMFLLMMSLITLFSVGLLLLPAALLAIVSAVAGSASGRLNSSRETDFS